MKISSPLYQRLISYTGVAAALVAANNKVAEAQIIYTDINPDYTHPDWTSGLYLLDINNDGIADFEFHTKGFNAAGYYGSCDWASKYMEALGSNEIMNIGKPVDNGFLIGSQENWNDNADLVKLICSNSSSDDYCFCHYSGNWEDEWGSKFIGLRFVKDNMTFYGWIRLKLIANFLEDYAFQSIPGEPIISGVVENCDTLQITVSPEDPVHVCAFLDENLEADYPATPYNVNFRWQKDNIDIPGEESKTLVVSQPGIYRAIIDGYGCADTSNAVPVTYSTIISPPPVISQHLDTLFSSPQSNYMWYKHNMLIPGATNQYYVISEDALYHCGYVDSLNCLSYLSNFYATTCANTSVSIIQESPGIACANGSYTIYSSALPANCIYQWLHNGEPVPGANNFCYAATEEGDYSVAIEGYQGCKDTSSLFQVIIDTVPTPHITLVNDSVLQSSSSTGNEWYLNNVFIPGANGTTYVPEVQGSYHVKVTDSYNCSSVSAPYYFYPVGMSNTIENDFSAIVNQRQIVLKFPSPYLNGRLSLLNTASQHLFESTINHSIMIIDVSTFPQGVYVVMADDGKKRRVKKIFIGE